MSPCDLPQGSRRQPLRRLGHVNEPTWQLEAERAEQLVTDPAREPVSRASTAAGREWLALPPISGG
jgi:hypothetical protein